MYKNSIHVLARGVIIDSGSILLRKTTTLPFNFYFLPGGHVEHGESAETSLIRELREETGAICKIKRFLGCLEYSFEPVHSGICHTHEYNFIFEIESDALKSGNKISQFESHIELLWLPLEQLSAVDFKAEVLKEFIPQWLKLAPSQIFRSVMV